VGKACPPIVEEHADVPAGTVFGGKEGGEAGLARRCLPVGQTSGGWLCGPKFVAGTPDLSHIVVVAEASLTPGSLVPGSHGGLYEWSAGKLAYIGEGLEADDNVFESIGDQFEAGRNALSSDGSRVVFTGSYEGVSGLLMHDMDTGQVVKLDAVQGGSGEGNTEPEYDDASTNGSRVFFTDEQRLTANSGAEPKRPDLYECEMIEEAGQLKCRLSDLTPPSSGESADMLGEVLGVSEDGSWVYFVADGALAPGAVHGGCIDTEESQPGKQCNLYAMHYSGSSWETPRLIAVLASDDDHDWVNQGRSVYNQPTRVSPNGEWLAFMSEEQLTGYDNRDAVSGRPDAEVYLYDAGTGGLACASCDPTGSRPTGTEFNRAETGTTDVWLETSPVAAWVPGSQETENGRNGSQVYPTRYLFNGGRLFFGSEDALVPLDVDGTKDVYEYEPEGAGGCGSSAASGSVVFKSGQRFSVEGRPGEEGAGCVGLISSGSSADRSIFLDASENGSEAFFMSTAQLVPQDLETSFSVYDARECTPQSPCAAAPVSPPPCETEASCRPSPTPQPTIFGPPASATFAGPGDVIPAPSPVAVVKKKVKKAASCKRGYVKSHGRCTRRRKPKAKKATVKGRSER
jgi:hypothetical protein